MPHFRKKTVEIEAVQWTGENRKEINMFGGQVLGIPFGSATTIRIVTLEGTMHASPGDWIIKGVQGEFYPCKPDIFEETYEWVPGPDDIAPRSPHREN